MPADQSPRAAFRADMAARNQARWVSGYRPQGGPAAFGSTAAPGNDLTDRFRLIVEALVWLRAASCIIDGEAVCCDNDGRPSFDRIRYRRMTPVSSYTRSI